MKKISNSINKLIEIIKLPIRGIPQDKIDQKLIFSYQLMNKWNKIEYPRVISIHQIHLNSSSAFYPNIAKRNLYFTGFKSIKPKFNSIVFCSNFNFSSANSKNYNDIKEKLKKEGKVKIYDSKYTFNSEKLMVHGSLIFMVISSSTLLFTNVSLWLKLVNVFFVFVPSLLIQLEYLINNTRFIKSLILLPNSNVQVTDMWGKNETIEIKNLIKASDDARLKNYSQSLNHQTFTIFTNKANKAIYHCPRDGVYWDEGIFHDIIEGKKIE